MLRVTDIPCIHGYTFQGLQVSPELTQSPLFDLIGLTFFALYCGYRVHTFQCILINTMLDMEKPIWRLFGEPRADRNHASKYTVCKSHLDAAGVRRKKNWLKYTLFLKDVKYLKYKNL